MLLVFMGQYIKDQEKNDKLEDGMKQQSLPWETASNRVSADPPWRNQYYVLEGAKLKTPFEMRLANWKDRRP